MNKTAVKQSCIHADLINDEQPILQPYFCPKILFLGSFSIFYSYLFISRCLIRYAKKTTVFSSFIALKTPYTRMIGKQMHLYQPACVCWLIKFFT